MAHLPRCLQCPGTKRTATLQISFLCSGGYFLPCFGGVALRAGISTTPALSLAQLWLLPTVHVVSEGGDVEPREGRIEALVAVPGNDDLAGGDGEEAGEDGDEDDIDHQEDEEGRFGVDLGPHQAHHQAEQEDEGAVEEAVEVALGEGLCAGKLRPIWRGRGRTRRSGQQGPKKPVCRATPSLVQGRPLPGPTALTRSKDIQDGFHQAQDVDATSTDVGQEEHEPDAPPKFRAQSPADHD